MKPPRSLRPKPDVIVRPASISQLNCLAVAGIDPRRFLETVVPRAAGSVAHLGRLRVVPIAVFEQVMRGLEATDLGERTAAPANDTRIDGEQFETVDEVLAAIGRERIAR